MKTDLNRLKSFLFNYNGTLPSAVILQNSNCLLGLFCVGLYQYTTYNEFYQIPLKSFLRKFKITGFY